MKQSLRKEPNWVVRGGVATPRQLQTGTAKHLGVPDPPGLFGFSIQYQPEKAIQELAAAGKFRNAQISVTTQEELIAAGLSAGYAVRIVKSPGAGYHHTVPVHFSITVGSGSSIEYCVHPKTQSCSFPQSLNAGGTHGKANLR